MKNNDYPKYFRNKGNDIYASYDGKKWFCTETRNVVNKK